MNRTKKNPQERNYLPFRPLNRIIPHDLFETRLMKKLLVCKYAPILWRLGLPPVDLSDPNNIYRKIADHKNFCRDAHKSGKLKVVILISTLGAGGSERQAVHLALELKKRGVDIEVLTLQTLEGPNAHYLPLLNEFKLRVTSIFGNPDSIFFGHRSPTFFESNQRLPTPLTPSYKIANFIDKAKPDIIHSWLDETNIWGAIAGIMAGTPGIIMSTRSVNPTQFSKKNAWTKHWYRILLNNNHVAIINNSAFGARDYGKWLGIKPTRIEVINNGVISDICGPFEERRNEENLHNKLGLRKENKIILGVMRLSEEKRPLLFIRSCLSILKMRPDSVCILIGDGPMSEQVKKIVEKSRLKERMILLNASKEVKNIMKISDLLILTSRVEGSPNVLIEAQSSGCPVLTTAAGGAVDAIQEGKTGFIIPAKPEKIAQKACDILENKILQSSLRVAGPPFVRSTFGMDNMVTRTLNLYHRVLDLA